MPVFLSRTCSRVFTDGTSGALDDPYLDDLAALHKLPRSPSSTWPATGVSRSYGEMAARVLEGCREPLESIELIVLAYANPEILVGEEAGPFLAAAFPATRMVYAVSDQGMLAPFTALKLATSHFRGDNFERAAIIVLEQRFLPLLSDDRAKTPACDVAVAVIVERRDSDTADACPPVILRNPGGHANVAEALLDIMNVTIPQLAGDPIIVLGESVPVIHELSAFSPNVHRAIPGRVCTGVWERLDQCVRNTQGYSRPVVAVEYDRALDCLGVASLHVW